MRRRRKRDIIIELTSLLDVIMIMIFMVMAENSRLLGENKDELAVVQTENEELAGEKDKLLGENEKLSEELALALAKLDEGSVEELLEKLKEAENRLQGYEYMNDVVKVVNIGLENKYGNTVRTLSYGESSAAKQNVFDVREDEDISSAVNQLRVYMNDYIKQANADASGSTIIYIVFSYDTTKVYQDDYAAVEKALRDAENRSENGNVRYRINRLNKDV